LFIELTAAENLAVAVSGSAHTGAFVHSPAEAQGRRDKAIELLERLDLPTSPTARSRNLQAACASFVDMPCGLSAGLNCCCSTNDIRRFG